MKRSMTRRCLTLLAATAAVAWSAMAAAHAFPQQEEPAVGSVVHDAPARVRIWFNAKLEPLFSNVVVKDAQGNKVSGDSSVDKDSQTLLEAPLQAHGPGVYHVYWSVVAWDGHHTEGDYIFTVKP